jgi:uncharacterized membrane protein YhaH (DUF805 family)
MNWGQLLFSFDGRIGRGAYWGFVLALVVVFAILCGVLFMTMDFSNPEAGMGLGGVLLTVAGLAVIWPSLAVQAKRWHDVDKSAWWILIGLVPAVGGLIALVFNGFIPGTPGPNKYGNPV